MSSHASLFQCDELDICFVLRFAACLGRVKGVFLRGKAGQDPHGLHLLLVPDSNSPTEDKTRWVFEGDEEKASTAEGMAMLETSIDIGGRFPMELPHDEFSPAALAQLQPLFDVPSPSPIGPPVKAGADGATASDTYHPCGQEKQGWDGPHHGHPASQKPKAGRAKPWSHAAAKRRQGSGQGEPACPLAAILRAHERKGGSGRWPTKIFTHPFTIRE